VYLERNPAPVREWDFYILKNDAPLTSFLSLVGERRINSLSPCGRGLG
jgi:hypothetical protein